MLLRRTPLRPGRPATTPCAKRISAHVQAVRCTPVCGSSRHQSSSAASVVMESMQDLVEHVASGKRLSVVQATLSSPPPLAPTHEPLIESDATFIHPTAVIDPLARVGLNVRIGPYSVVGPDVVLEDGVVLHSHVVVEGKTRIGRGTVVHPFACLGGEPQDKKHKLHIPTDIAPFTLEIGQHCVIREHVTIHGSTAYSAHTPTKLGDHCWILCGAHVGHDVQIGSHVVLSNNVCVAGHVEIGNFAIIGGQVGLKQHIKIGSLAMVGGGSAVDGDVIPYGLVNGNRAKLLGLNLIGLRRAKVSRHEIKLMLRLVRYLFGSSLSSIATVCPKTGFAPALDLPYHESLLVRGCEAKKYLSEEEITASAYPLVHEIVNFVLQSPERAKSSLCQAMLH
ncbi:hypothetical protein Poli38472_004077 [Pythium oligandrum]|uniref:UDP N-acetylglucosamine O-acyltransferase C-terminal domain-containing protein n=1 Tax=Pythium oligandrum TaxID=41045 RepID=A0A8K1CPM2_PYTOL|nr:hypothetical protein Poli38472_004077 [Pythium oligandrum]|eukprot:TMW66312.1 hypothetical protein Poli38472_004077 [Pythium oligandrum]